MVPQTCLCIIAGLLAFHARLAAQEMEVTFAPFVVNGYALPDDSWEYGSIEGFEVLSQSSHRLTREVVAALWRGRQLALPPEMRTHFDAPMVVMVFNHPPIDSMPQSLGREKHPGEMNRHWTNVIKRRSIDRESFAINLWESEFQYSPGFRFDMLTLLRRRAPGVPLWLNESLFGGFGIYREGIGLDEAERVKNIKPLSWCSAAELREILKFESDERRKMVVEKRRHAFRSKFAPLLQPLRSIFEDAPPGEPLGVARWRSTAALFARWGVYAKPEAAANFWTFAQLACRQPITEESFRQCFGKSYDEVQAELSWYIVDALTEYVSAPAQLTPMPHLSMRPARHSEVARMFGEWERIEAESLEATAPEIARKYRTHALEKLQRSYERGARDPRLLATLGLLAASGDSAGARGYLEQAVKGDVAGPFAYLELARLRWAAVRKSEPAESKEREAGDVVALLLKAEMKGPPLREVYAMLAEVNPGVSDFGQQRKTALRRGLDFFPLDPELSQKIERALDGDVAQLGW